MATLLIVGDSCLKKVIDVFGGSIRILRLDISGPAQLPLATRDRLIQVAALANREDLAIYLKADLVIYDPYYFNKIALVLSAYATSAVSDAQSL